MPDRGEHPWLFYVKNHAMGFEVPYQYEGKQRRYIPDFILKVTMATAKRICSILLLRSKATEAKKRSKTYDYGHLLCLV